MTSSVRMEPFALLDLHAMDVQDQHAYLVPFVIAAHLSTSRLMVSPWSWTMWSAAGIPLGACGIIEENSYAWAFLSRHIGSHMISASRRAREMLDTYLQACGSVYAIIDRDHSEAVRWALLLRFSPSPTEEVEGRWAFRRGGIA